MADYLANLSPSEAWLPFEPTSAQPFDRRLAAHLHRRAGFAAPSHELDETVRLGPQQTVKRLLAARDQSPTFDGEMHRFANLTLAGGNRELLAGWWLALAHIASGIALFITIIGIPLAIADFKMVPISLMPLGKDIVSTRDGAFDRTLTSR